jgi:ATP-dependent DNA ligase
MSRDQWLVHKPVEPEKVKKDKRPSEHDLCNHYIVQPKYDGCALVIFVHSIADDKGLFSTNIRTRTGEHVASCYHIEEAIAHFPAIKPGVYFGEAWQKGRTAAEISGDVRRHSAAPDLQCVIYDYVTHDEFQQGFSDLGYEERIMRLPEPFFRIAQEGNPIWPATCEGTLAEWELTPMQAAKQYVELGGYDGIILRDPRGKWSRGVGTNGEIIKVKTKLSYALRVVGWEPGKGKHAGKIGTLLVSFNGKTQGAGTGLKDSERLLEEYNDRWANKIVEIEAMGLTADGLLREPRLKGVRVDVMEPDA